MAVTYAFDFVLANFGIAIAAKMPMMTTTISSSMSVKPLRARCVMDMELPWGEEKWEHSTLTPLRGWSVITDPIKATRGPVGSHIHKPLPCQRLVNSHAGQCAGLWHSICIAA